MYLTGKLDRNSIADFKTGDFVVRDANAAYRLAHLLQRVDDSLLQSNEIFQTVLFLILRDPNFDREAFASQLNRNPQSMGPFNDVKTCAEQIENVCNYGKSQKNRIVIRSEYIGVGSTKISRTIPMLTIQNEVPLTEEVNVVQ
jgi:hypothetical protein